MLATSNPAPRTNGSPKKARAVKNGTAKSQVNTSAHSKSKDTEVIATETDSTPETIKSVENNSNWIFRTAPVAIMARWYTLDVSYNISKNWATGPAVISYASGTMGGMLAPTYRGYAIGWNGNYYFNSVRVDGWYASLHAYYENYDSYPEGYSGYVAINGFKANSAVGYRWIIGNFDILAGLGMENRIHTTTDHRERYLLIDGSPTMIQEPTSNASDWLPFAEIKIGFIRFPIGS
jgi:hypothetical protein